MRRISKNKYGAPVLRPWLELKLRDAIMKGNVRALLIGAECVME